MQSADYVPGVSGWRMEKGWFEINGGPHGPVRIGNLEASVETPSDEQLAALCLTRQDLAEPFIVVDGVTYINEALIPSCAVDADRFKVKMSLNESGQYVAAGVGLGMDASEILDLLSSQISQSDLASALSEWNTKVADPSEIARQVIRQELKPGGLLHRR